MIDIKIRIRIFILIISYFLITICAPSCINTSLQEIPSSQAIEKMLTDESRDITDQVCIDNDLSIQSKVNSTDYQEYIKKIWIVDNWSQNRLYSFSFRIAKIYNGVIEGELVTQSIAMPHCYTNANAYSQYKDNIFGTINNNIAECSFESGVGNKGIVILEFKGNDKIDASIEYTSKGEFSTDLRAGHFSYRPYNITDLEGFVENKELFIETNLNAWGDVSIVAGRYEGNKTVPAVFLADAQGNILYNFGAPYQVDTDVLEVLVKDLDENGLVDVQISTYLPYAPDAYRFEWIFYQMNNGWFHMEKGGDIP